MSRALSWLAAAAATGLLMAACTDADTSTEPSVEPSAREATEPAEDTAQQSPDAGASSATAGTDDAAATSAGPELNTFVPVDAGTERVWPEEIETVSEGDKEFTLFGVHRLDDERVVVTGRIAGAVSSTAAAEWFEPGFFHTMGGYEFSNVALVDADGARHLTVRDENDRCLCSLSTAVYDELGDEGQAPAWAVVGVPGDQDTIDVEVTGVGTIEDVPVTELPETDSTPFGWNEVLTIDGVTRESGVVSARTTIANTGDFLPSYNLPQHAFGFEELGGQHCFQGLAAYGGPQPTGRMAVDDQCHGGSMPEPAHQITLDVKVADPGGERVVILPDAGLPLVTAAEGSPTQGAEESLRTYLPRTEQAGATVEEGQELTVSLDTEVLFEFDQAELTADADEALAVAAETLKAQDVRAIVVAGHTDGQGSAERNLELSQARAEAVAEALEADLGDGWDITVEWHGMDQPVADESGTPAQVEAAQARNRRVEITVP